jgi:hypothetical protein
VFLFAIAGGGGHAGQGAGKKEGKKRAHGGISMVRRGDATRLR